MTVIGRSVEKQLEAFAEARNESVEDLLDGRTEDLLQRLQGASADASPAGVPLGSALTVLRTLPSMDELIVNPSNRVVELRNDVLILYAFAFEPDESLFVIVGVASFPGEELDLRRRQAFVPIELSGVAHFMTLDAFERGYKGLSDERSFLITEIRDRELTEEEGQLVGYTRGEDPN